MNPLIDKIKVLIADDHAILLAGLKVLIDSQIDMEVVSEASDAEKAIQAALAFKPDVAVLDLSMPGGGGLKAIQEITRDCREIRLLVLTMHDDPTYLESALAAGASGYLLKRAADTELITAIRTVHQGRSFVDPLLPKDLPSDARERDETHKSANPSNNLL